MQVATNLTAMQFAFYSKILLEQFKGFCLIHVSLKSSDIFLLTEVLTDGLIFAKWPRGPLATVQVKSTGGDVV